MKYADIPTQAIIDRTADALRANGMTVHVVDTGEEAKRLALSLIPENSPVMTMTSRTLEETGIDESINESGTYRSLKKELYGMDRSSQNREMQALGAAPEYTLGSVHAITETGEVIIASNTGSQLPAYAYGSEHVIWIAGVQKIVPSVEEGFTRIKEYVLPLESERAKKAYGVPGSNISKLLIVSKEINPDRIKLILVKEKLGF